MDVPGRLAPLPAQYGLACERLVRRMTGPAFDSGNGVRLEVDPVSDEELLWEPVRGCWPVRPRSGGPGAGATSLVYHLAATRSGGAFPRNAVRCPGSPWREVRSDPGVGGEPADRVAAAHEAPTA